MFPDASKVLYMVSKGSLSSCPRGSWYLYDTFFFLFLLHLLPVHDLFSASHP